MKPEALYYTWHPKKTTCGYEELLPPQKRGCLTSRPPFLELWTKKPLSGEYASHFGLELRWRNILPPGWIVKSTHFPSSHSTKRVLRLEVSKHPGVGGVKLLFDQTHIVEQTPEMKDMMIQRDIFWHGLWAAGRLDFHSLGDIF